MYNVPIFQQLPYYSMYEQIKVNFLPVGHTHEDVDQMFSRLSEYLKKQGAESLNGMYEHSRCILYIILCSTHT